MLELLAPAGSMEALRAAVQNGANAVYLGCGQFNARQGAKNFTPQALQEAVKYCHIRGVQVHLTLNTLVSDKETPEAVELIRHAAQCAVDAFIVQDLGILRLCRQIAPHIPVHGSTQMTVHNLPGVLFCAAMGMKRVVLSRELNCDQIRYITQNSPIEIEVFAHGALCMGYSGQCYLSAAIGSRSGNRGRCAQPCRQSYGYGRYQNKNPLSLKDNCLVHYLQQLQQMGVASVKLEGRMKRAEYVAAVTSVYRKAIDSGKVTGTMMDSLHTAFNRQGFTDGYYQGKIGPHMFGVREDTKEDSQWLRQMRQSYEGVENALVPVVFSCTIRANCTQLSVTDPEGRVCTLEGPRAEIARTMELGEDALRARLSKTGGTPYVCKQVQVDIEPGYTLSAAAINALRRDVLNLLTARRARRNLPKLGATPKTVRFNGNRGRPELTVQVTTREQITPKLIKMAPSVLYVPIHILSSDIDFCQDLARRVNVCAVLPRIISDAQLPDYVRDMKLLSKFGVKEVLLSNLGQLIPVHECDMTARGDFGLNLYNSLAVNTAREAELRSVCLSFEMKLAQIRDVSKGVPCEILCYGRLPLMVTENCLIRSRTGQCTCHLSSAKIVDKTGAEFPIIRDGNTCRSVLLNGKKLNWLDRQDELAGLGLWAMRLLFTTENPKEVDNVLSSIHEPTDFDPGSATRGLYLRGVE